MALIRYVYSGDNRILYFAIVADDTQVQYVWPMDDEEAAWFESDERIEMLLSFESQERPTTAQEWNDMASFHLGSVAFADTEVADFKTGLSTALRNLINANPPTETAGYSPSAGSAAASWDTVSEDYPQLGDVDDAGDDLDPEATLHWVLQKLGPIDPEGPNGWLLRAADGEPRPGDENAYVHYDLPAYNVREPETTEVPSE